MSVNNNVKALFEYECFSLKAQNQIEKTVLRYTKPAGFCRKLGYLACRIKNFFLSLICCSDWQRTQRLIKREAYRPINDALRALDILLKISKGDRDEIIKRRKESVNSLFNTGAEFLSQNFLSLALNVQQNRIDCLTDLACMEAIFNPEARARKKHLLKEIVKIAVCD